MHHVVTVNYEKVSPTDRACSLAVPEVMEGGEREAP